MSLGEIRLEPTYATAATSSGEPAKRDDHHELYSAIASLREMMERKFSDLEGRITVLEGRIGHMRVSSESPYFSSSISIASSSMPSLPSSSLSSPAHSAEELSYEEFQKTIHERRLEGEKQIKNGMFDEAIETFEKIMLTLHQSGYPFVKKKGDLYLAQLNISKAFESKKDYASAIAKAKLAMKNANDKKDNSARAQIALCLAKDDKPNEAKKMLEGYSPGFKFARKVNPTYPEWHLANAMIDWIDSKYLASFNEIMFVLKSDVFNTTAIECLANIVRGETSEDNLKKMSLALSSLLEKNSKEKKNCNDKLVTLYEELSRKILTSSVLRLSCPKE